jgi:hypothetical protein
MTLDPSTAFADGQIVRVRGEGFTPGASLTVVECAAEARNPDFGCPNTSVRSVIADASGSFATTTRLVRDLFFPDAPVGNAAETDCGTSAGTCELWAAHLGDDSESVIVPLTFDPSAPAIGLLITVSPAGNLVDGQTVHVAARGFPPAVPIPVAQCRRGFVDAFGCDHFVTVTSDDKGHVDTDYVVHRFLFSNPPEPPDAATIDCAATPESCTLSAAFLGPRTEAATTPLTFTRIDEPPVVTVEQPVAPPAEEPTAGGDASPARARPSTNEPLPLTGTESRDDLRLASLLLVAGGASVLAAGELRWRTRRRLVRRTSA